MSEHHLPHRAKGIAVGRDVGEGVVVIEIESPDAVARVEALVGHASSALKLNL